MRKHADAPRYRFKPSGSQATTQISVLKKTTTFSTIRKKVIAPEFGGERVPRLLGLQGEVEFRGIRQATARFFYGRHDEIRPERRKGKPESGLGPDLVSTEKLVRSLEPGFRVRLDRSLIKRAERALHTEHLKSMEAMCGTTRSVDTTEESLEERKAGRSDLPARHSSRSPWRCARRPESLPRRTAQPGSCAKTARPEHSTESEASTGVE